MDLHRLQIFHTVARRLSFSQAAEDHYTSQPNVSKHIRQLERELGVTLFHRLGTRVVLTDAGRIVYDYAQRVFDLTEGVRRALAELEGLERGYLRLGASSTPGLYLLPPALASFRQRYPSLEASLEIANTQSVVEGVLGNTLDLGFVEGEVTEPSIQVQPFTTDELVLIAASGHTLARTPPVTPEALAGETFILREEGSGTRQVMEAVLPRLGIAPRRVMVMSSCEGVKRAVAAGLGVSFVSKSAVELEVAQGMLTIVDGPGLRVPHPLYIISHKDVRLSAAALAFVAHVRKAASSRP